MCSRGSEKIILITIIAILIVTIIYFSKFTIKIIIANNPKMKKELDSKSVVNFYFTQKEDSPGIYECRHCGKPRRQKAGSGYQNLLEHLNRFHPDWKEIMSTVDSSSHGSRSILSKYIDSKSSSIYGWIRWIVARNLPFNFFEDEITRQFVNLKPISVETLMEYMELVLMEVELKIKEILPEKFAIIFDGWSEESTHFIGIYVKDSKGQYLLAFTPLYDETDLSAESQSALIFDTLELYGKGVSNVICLIGDNCVTNKSVANKLGVPFIGCASHRFNLAVDSYLYEFVGVLDKVLFLIVRLEQVASIAKKLRTIKNSAKLRRNTPLRPVLRNATRWSRTSWN